MPEERQMFFRDFVDLVLDPSSTSSHGAPYLSYQNDSVRKELPGLVADLGRTPDVLQSAFKSRSDETDHSPDAVNIWIGDSRSTTSLHKDPYENLYYVLTGEKVFTLFPPTAFPFLGEQRYPAARYKQDEEGQWTTIAEEGIDPVPWVMDQTTGGLTIRVQAGQCLYLPSLWYHRVEQIGVTVAVNFWYDMAFDAKWVYYQFLRRITHVYEHQKKPTDGRTIRKLHPR